MKPTPDQITGILRAIIPAVMAYAAGKGIDLSWLMNPDVIAGLAAIGCAAWSVQSKRQRKTKTKDPQQPNQSSQV